MTVDLCESYVRVGARLGISRQSVARRAESAAGSSGSLRCHYRNGRDHERRSHMWSGTTGGGLFPANIVGEIRCKSTTVPNSWLRQIGY